MRVLSFPFLARPSQGPATWLVNRDDVHLVRWHVLVKFSALNNQPEETDKMCRKINSQKGTL